MSSATWAVRAAARGVAREGGGAACVQRRRLPRARRRLRRRSRTTRSSPSERASTWASTSSPIPPPTSSGRSRRFPSRTPPSTSSSARRCSSTATTPRSAVARAAARDRPGRPRAGVDARRPGLPPLAARLLALDARGAAQAVRRKARTGTSVAGHAGGRNRVDLAMLLGTYIEIASATHTARPWPGLATKPCREQRSIGGCASLREPIPGSLTANFHVVAHLDGTALRFFRRNALGVYAVYGAAIVSGLVVTPIVLHELGTETFGIWSFIGSITIYLSVLDFGLGPSVVRFTAEARGRGRPEDTNEVASVALALYAAIGVVTLVAGTALSWLVPLADRDARRPRLGRPHRDVPGHALARGALPARALLQPARRAPALRRPEPRQLHRRPSLYAVLVAILIPRGGGLVLLGALTFAVTIAQARVCRSPGCAREFPELRLSRALRDAAARARSRLGELEQLPRSRCEQGGLLDRRCRRRDRARPAGGGDLRHRVAALPARVRARQRRHRLCSTRLRRVRGRRRRSTASAGCCSPASAAASAAALVLALPLLLIPDQLIKAWVGEGYGELGRRCSLCSRSSSSSTSRSGC